jgi:hypothetical protein
MAALLQSRHLGRHARRARSESLIANLVLAILTLLIALCLALLAPILRTALMESTVPKPQACGTMKTSAQWAACRERQAGAPASDMTAPGAPGAGRAEP